MNTHRGKAITQAARDVIEHGGPDCLTNPRIPLDSMQAALDAGADPDDIRAEINRQRHT